MFKNVATAAALFAFGFHASAVAQETTKSDAIKKLEKFGFDETSFVDGNLYFIAYHEIAHALVSEFNLPVIGREEDAADRLAIILMTPEEKEQEPEYLLGAIQGWFATANYTPLNEIPWWDSHGTDKQRGFQIACLLYGNDDKRYKKIANSVDLPEDRREECVYESEQNTNAWRSLLEPHLVPDGEEPPEGAIPVTYEPTKDYADDLDYLKKLALLEDISKFMSDNYKFETGIKITAKECGEANAYWYGEERSLVMCYELVKDFRDLTKE